MNRRNVGLLGFWILVGSCLLVGSAAACPASYVKREADKAQGTSLHDKATRVADEYMKEKGIDSTSSHAEIIRPYIVGTSLVDHQKAKRWGGNAFNSSAHVLDKSIDACVRDSLNCQHHSQHFGEAKKQADREVDVVLPVAVPWGG